MLTDSRSGPLDLVVIGGLTVDRFADGSAAPGGSVLHIARAAAHRDLRVGVITSAGPEPEAQQGLDELRRLSALMESTPGGVTTTYRHRESAEGRRLWLERRGAAVLLPADAYGRIRTSAILYAPVAGEVGPEALTVWDDSWMRGAILQGWLRATDPSGEVRPQPLSALDGPLVEALSGLDLLVASREDLLAESDDPHRQLKSLRRTFGRRPMLIVTDGIEGVWLGTAHRWRIFEPQHLAAPWTVEGASTVGAGDIFAAFMTMRSRDSTIGADQHAASAMRIVAEELESRLDR